MIEFVDLKNGKVFHVDHTNMERDGKRIYTQAPYTFWFENGQSTNLNYVRKICFISDKPLVRVTMQSPIFSILKLGQDIPMFNEEERENINAKDYLDLKKLKTDSYIMNGYRYKGFYVYMLYILASSGDAGEYRDTFVLDGGEYEVGADFYNNNEILKSNLENFDISIPESIQKAIYDVCVHEESNDNITLNRKYKELLMNYWDIVANKGSYNSLLNSLAWFEWGDLVRIEELWKRHQENLTDYFSESLNRKLDDEFIKQFVNNSKTTYIGLYMALSRLTYQDGRLEYQDSVGANQPIEAESVGNRIYNPFQRDLDAYESIGIEPASIGESNPQEPPHYGIGHAHVTDIWPEENPLDGSVVVYNENMPHLELITTKWQMLDLCLKMTLLGNFYSTYFVPIHMDVVHSTVEHWVFGYAYKMLGVHTSYFENTVNHGGPFDMEWDRRVQVRRHDARVYSTTLFKAPRLTNGTPTKVFGMETAVHQDTDPSFNFLPYFYGGSAGLVHFHGRIPACSDDDVVVKEKLIWYSSTGDTGMIQDSVCITPDMWFEKDSKATYEPGHFVRVEPGIYERPYPGRPTLTTQPQEAQDYYPVRRGYMDDHSWVMLGATCNYLAVINPDINHKSIVPGTDTEIPYVDEFRGVGGNYTSYPGADTYGIRNTVNLDFDLGFQHAGEYILMFEFEMSSGNRWTATCQTTVTDDIRNHIELYRVLHRNDLKSLDINNIKPWLNAFQMKAAVTDSNFMNVSGDMIYTPYRDHSIFISNHGDLGFNHTVIFKVPIGVDLRFTLRNGQTMNFLVNEDFVRNADNIIKEAFNGHEYIWMVNQYEGSPDVSFVGIRTRYQDGVDDLEIADITSPTYITSILMQPYVKDGKLYYMSDYRFHPIMHTLVPFTTFAGYTIHKGEVLYADPVLKYSKDIEACNWDFVNESRQNHWESILVESSHYRDGHSYGDNGTMVPGGTGGSLVLPYNQDNMEPGYYTIRLRYMKDSEEQVVECRSAFVLGK